MRSTRRTRRLKIEAQRRLGLKIAGDALRTHETRTHGQKPSQMGEEGRKEEEGGIKPNFWVGKEREEKTKRERLKG